MNGKSEHSIPLLRARIRKSLPDATVNRRYRASAVDGEPAEFTLVTTENIAASNAAAATLSRIFETPCTPVGTSIQRYEPARHLLFDGHRIEMMTRRYARLQGLFTGPERPWLALVAGYFSSAEDGLDPPVPEMPAEAARWMLQLGITSPAMTSIASARPVFVHCTRTGESLAAILSEGVIRCGAKVPEHTPRFDPNGDRWSGRDTSVMLNVGFGRLVDNPSMLAAFVFAEQLAQDEIMVHRRPVMWEVARTIVDHVAREHPQLLLEVAHNLDRARAHSPLGGYLAECAQARQVVLHDSGSAMIAQYQLEIVRRLHEQGPASAHLGPRIDRWRDRNRMPGGLRAIEEIRGTWTTGNAYRLPYMQPMPPARQDGTQLLIPEALPLRDPAFVAIALSKTRTDEALEVLRNLEPQTIQRFQDLPVLMPHAVTSLAALVKQVQPVTVHPKRIP